MGCPSSMQHCYSLMRGPISMLSLPCHPSIHRNYCRRPRLGTTPLTGDYVGMAPRISHPGPAPRISKKLQQQSSGGRFNPQPLPGPQKHNSGTAKIASQGRMAGPR